MKTLQDMIKDLTDINVEQNKIDNYLKKEVLDLQYADLQDANLQGADLQYANLQGADLQGAKITKSQLEQLIIEDDK